LDHHEDVAKPKFTFTECIAAIILSLAIVTMLAVFLVVRIEDVVEAGIPDQFLGLIMLPLVEKAAEHLTAVDEAWDGQIVSHTASRVATEIQGLYGQTPNGSQFLSGICCRLRRERLSLSQCPANISQNFALFHCIGPSIQTALFNAPLVVVVGWALGKDMDLNFEIFMIVLLVLSIVVVGNFLRDGESNYLEGSLLVVSNTQDAQAVR
jgi:Ca2+:H+ antiporter